MTQRPRFNGIMKAKPRGKPFEKGREKTGGRKKGTPNHIKLLEKRLTKAAFTAMESHGSDGKGKGGLDGFMQLMMREHPEAFLRTVAAPSLLKEQEAELMQLRSMQGQDATTAVQLNQRINVTRNSSPVDLLGYDEQKLKQLPLQELSKLYAQKMRTPFIPPPSLDEEGDDSA
jgi:hypothetical protein